MLSFSIEEKIELIAEMRLLYIFLKEYSFQRLIGHYCSSSLFRSPIPMMLPLSHLTSQLQQQHLSSTTIISSSQPHMLCDDFARHQMKSEVLALLSRVRTMRHKHAQTASSKQEYPGG